LDLKSILVTFIYLPVVAAPTFGALYPRFGAIRWSLLISPIWQAKLRGSLCLPLFGSDRHADKNLEASKLKSSSQVSGP
jgi:hypothetical protein